MATKKYVGENALLYFWGKIKTLVATKVDKVEGKGLSTNDYTTEEKTKLSGIDTGAEVNVIESVVINGTTATITNKTASVNISAGSIDTISVNGTNVPADQNKNVNIAVPTKVSDITNDSGFITGINSNDVTTALGYTPYNATNPSGYQNATEVQALIDASVVTVYKAKGSVAFASLPSLVAANEGNVYNVTDSFTTTSDFVEGAGNTYPAGTNVAIINTTGTTYKYDVLGGFVDLTGYVQFTDLVELTNGEIDTITSN